MLGWEYPPHISGGLGTACQGLSKAVAALGPQISFVVPQLYGSEDAPHMTLVEPEPRPERPRQHLAAESREFGATTDNLRTIGIGAELLPYMSAAQYDAWIARANAAAPVRHPTTSESKAAKGESSAPTQAVPKRQSGATAVDAVTDALQLGAEQPRPEGGGHYGENLFTEVGRYAERVGNWIDSEEPFDVVHAHDWMTYPAGLLAAQKLGVPLVLHVHSLEADRAGGGGNPRIIAIEKAALERADRIITVSYFTRDLTHRVHGIPLEKIDVVHNGVYAPAVTAAHREELPREGPMVLFLGRVTLQKGPDYFVEAIVKVIPSVPNLTVVMAGDGDMLSRMRGRVSELGLESHFRFPGFVSGREAERLYSLADAYVMPSVSEPFGLTALEAMSHDTPVILSRQSGASEIMHHALKVDFWDIERLASLIISVLKYPELGSTLAGMAKEEVRHIHWNAAAVKVMNTYRAVTGV